MRPVSRSPSATMIPRVSPTWRTARSTFGSSRGTTGNTTSSRRLRLSFANPTTDVSGVRSSWLTLDEEPALRLARVLRDPAGVVRLRHGVNEIGRPLGDALLQGPVLRLELGIQAGGLDRAREQRRDRVQQRAVAGPEVAARPAVVNEEHANAPALREERRPHEPAGPEHGRQAGGCPRRGRRRRPGTGAAPPRGRARRGPTSRRRAGPARPRRAGRARRPAGDPAATSVPVAGSTNAISPRSKPRFPTISPSPRSTSSSRSWVEPSAIPIALIPASSASRSRRSCARSASSRAWSASCTAPVAGHGAERPARRLSARTLPRAPGRWRDPRARRSP